MAESIPVLTYDAAFERYDVALRRA